MSLTDNPRPECTCTSTMDTDPETGNPATPRIDPNCPYHGNSPTAAVPDPSPEVTDPAAEESGFTEADEPTEEDLEARDIEGAALAHEGDEVDEEAT